MKDKVMYEIVAILRAAGWRVRNGGWPATLAGEARWDFCYSRWSDGELTVTPMNAAAGRASQALIDNWRTSRYCPRRDEMTEAEYRQGLEGVNDGRAGSHE